MAVLVAEISVQNAGFSNEKDASVPHLSHLNLLQVQDFVYTRFMQGVCQILCTVTRGVAPPVTSKVKGLVVKFFQQLAPLIRPHLWEAILKCLTLAKALG